MNKFQLKNILTDIRFWILLLFLIRLIGISNPPLEGAHSWRQSLTNMMARNFLEIDSNIFFPRIDMAGNKTGILGSEFPLFSYLIYLFSAAFDYSHWYGRLINLLVSSFGLLYFFKLLKKLYTEQIAFNSTIVLGVSIWFAFSRKIMPDTFSVSLMIIGLFYAYQYIKKDKYVYLIWFFVFSTLGMLTKIPALSLLSILGVVVFMKSINWKRKIIVLATAALSFIIAALWYFYWVPYLLETYDFQLYFPKTMMEGLNEIKAVIPQLLEKFYFASLHSYIAFLAFLAGVYFFLKNENKITRLAALIFTVVFVLFIIKTGDIFPTHSYYIIPFTPLMALMVGYFLNRIPIKYQYILLLLISVEAIANQQHDFFIKEKEEYRLELEEIMQKQNPNKELIIINGGLSPQEMYFAHQKGWSVENDVILNETKIDSLSQLGAKFLVIDRIRLDQQITKDLVYSNEAYYVYKLGSK